jgi:hypothetical protein
MTKKRRPTVIGSLVGGIFGLIYTIYSVLIYGYTNNSPSFVFGIANVLYFSLLGFIFGVIFGLVLKDKSIQKWHIGAILGLVAFIIIILLTSIKTTGLECRSLDIKYESCSPGDFFTFMILEGPFPLHLLQIFLILLGMLIGLIASNREIIGLSRKK